MTGQPLRVAIVTRSLMTGGAQRHIVKLCQEIPGDEAALSVFLLIGDEPQDLLPELQRSKIPVFVSPYPRHDPRVIRWLATHLRTAQINVVHSFLWTADATAALSRQLYGGPPLICSERGDRGAGVYYSKARNLYDRLFPFRVAKCFCANSEFGAQLLVNLGCSHRKLTYIHNGVNLNHIDSMPPNNMRQAFGWPADCPIVGIVSRLDWYKGVDTFLGAMARLPDLPAQYVVVGDGPQREHLAQMSRDLKIQERLTCFGHQKNVERLVKDFDVAILAPRTATEHCSNSILEYMACRKPVIATRVGGNPELVVDGETGYLVAPDQPVAMSEAIRKLLATPALARRMGEAGRARIESGFTMERVASRFVSLWRDAAVA